MGDTLANTLPLAALDMALTQRCPTGGLLHHSDQGVQYASRNYRQRLAQAGAVPSMSRRGNCYDNAAIFEWIEVFYNRERFHSALGFKSRACEVQARLACGFLISPRGQSTGQSKSKKKMPVDSSSMEQISK
jgi:transposase InsO family protein